MTKTKDIDPLETSEWLDAIQDVLKKDGKERAEFLINRLNQALIDKGKSYFFTKEGLLNTPYVNTISVEEQVSYPGDVSLEEKITNLVRWNSMAMVLRANKKSDGIGGHIASFASSATLYEVAYNHFFKGPKGDFTGDKVFFQGHTSPGIYARAFLEGVLDEENLDNYRRELNPESLGKGLPSYPHPRLMSNFWQFPTVSMGLGPISAIYLAKFQKYLLNRGIKDTSKTNVFAFIGDGETDEVETLGALDVAVREKLDNLVFIINCNLQRLDGPVRGNGKIIQELEAVFKGFGWNTLKVVWGSKWDSLLERDHDGALKRLLNKTVDGEYQKISTMTGEERRRDFYAKDEQVLKLVSSLSDDDLENLNRGGHDEKKVYAAYDYAINNKNGRPTVILAKTIKGFGMGESGHGKNIAHQQKKMSLDSLKEFRNNFSIPVPEESLATTPYYKPKKDSPEMKYLADVRNRLGGFLPNRQADFTPLPELEKNIFSKVDAGTKREVSTTMAFVQILTSLLRSKAVSKYIVPIVPDESRTFGMEGLFSQHGIYSPQGQLYTPVDKKSLMSYTEAKDGQLLQEGINEAGAMASFIAAGTAYSHEKLPMVPFYIFYSMFGFQRTGDQIWAAADMMTKGFLLGGTAGRTTLNGEGLQHQDGHSQILASTVPSIKAYDPAYAYEIAAIVEDGIKRMYHDKENCFYYLTLYNENYIQAPLPEIPDIKEKINKGLYKLRSSKNKVNGKKKIHLFASGISVPASLKAAEFLEKEFAIPADVWSVTSYKSLREDAIQVERWNMLNPSEKPKTSFLADTLKDEVGHFVGVSDYMRLYVDMISRFVPGGIYPLGTDGFGLSSSREELREYFETDENFIVLASLYHLQQNGDFSKVDYEKAMKKLKIDPKKNNGLEG